MEAKLNTLYSLVLVCSWIICARCVWRQTALSKNKRLSIATFTWHAGMLILSFTFGAATQIDKLLATLPLATLALVLGFFSSQAQSSEKFLGRPRNVILVATIGSLTIAALQLIGGDPRVLSTAFLLFAVYQAQTAVTKSYLEQIRDFRGVREKLLSLESTVRIEQTANAVRSSASEPVIIDKAI